MQCPCLVSWVANCPPCECSQYSYDYTWTEQHASIVPRPYVLSRNLDWTLQLLLFSPFVFVWLLYSRTVSIPYGGLACISDGRLKLTSFPGSPCWGEGRGLSLGIEPYTLLGEHNGTIGSSTCSLLVPLSALETSHKMWTVPALYVAWWPSLASICRLDTCLLY